LQIFLLLWNEKKALKATQEGFPTIALAGVWGFRTKKGPIEGKSLPLPEFDGIPMCGRAIRIIYDSDLATNQQVQKALRVLAEYCQGRGATVFIIHLPSGKDGEKVGLDDFLCHVGHDGLRALVETSPALLEDDAALLDSKGPSAADMADAYLEHRDLTCAEGTLLRWHRQEWLRYNCHSFFPWPEGELKADIADYLRGTPARKKTSPHFVHSMLLHLQAQCLLPAAVSLPARREGKIWLPCPDVVIVQNGILDLVAILNASLSAALTPHSAALVSRVELPYAYDPDAHCPRWCQFVTEVLPEPESRTLLQQMFGYCLTGDTSRQTFFLLEGNGANGKSVALRVLTLLLGEANVSSLPIESFSRTHDLVTTLGKLVNITSEVGDLGRVDEGLLKQFTGDDTMHFNPKFREPFSAKPTAKLIIAANVRPAFRDRSGGVWRRMKLLPFPITIPSEKQNPHLVTELAGELSGILNWAIDGAHSLREAGHFIESPGGRAAKEAYQRESNPAQCFLEEFCEQDAAAQVPTDDLYQAYAPYCVDRGYHPLNQAHFGRVLRTIYPEIQRERVTIKGHRFWVYRGLRMAGYAVS